MASTKSVTAIFNAVVVPSDTDGVVNTTTNSLSSAGSSFSSLAAGDTIQITDTGAGGHATAGNYTVDSVTNSTYLVLTTDPTDGTNDTAVDFKARKTSNAVVLDDGYGAALHVKITNGGTGPTVAGSVQIEVSADNSEWYEFGGALTGGTGNSGKLSWGGIEIPIGVEYLRVRAGDNTVEDVTYDVDISEVTAVS